MSADDGLSISNFEVKPGETKTVSVVMNNVSVVAGFQFDLVLPTGITLNNAELSNVRTSYAYNLSQKTQADGSIRLLVMPKASDKAVFDGDTGEVMNLTLVVADDARGKANIVLKNQILTVVNVDSFEDYTVGVTTTEVSIAPAYIVGDVNGDGVVNVSDVTTLISFILGETENVRGKADVNGDDSVNLSDVDALVSIILEK